MASSSSSRLDSILQNLIAKFALQFLVLITNNASVPPTKKQWCATTGRETLLDNCGCRDFQSKQSFQSYGQLKEFIDGWVQKKTMFLSTHNNNLPCPYLLLCPEEFFKSLFCHLVSCNPFVDNLLSNCL
jgi:hypothetical protein